MQTEAMERTIPPLPAYRDDDRLDEGMKRLALAVLRQAIEDASRQGAEGARAQAWLYGRSAVLAHGCSVAAIGDTTALHRWLRRLEARHGA